MAEVSWVKLKVNTFDDKKIKLILSQKDGDKTIVIFFKIFCFSGEVNDNGYIYLDKKKPLTDEELAEIISEDTVTLRNAFVTLREHNILVRQEENGHFLLRNFMKHQNVEGLEKIKTKGAERAKRYRERIKGLLKQEEPLITIKEGSVTHNVTDNVTVTSRHAVDIDIKNKSKKEIIVVVGQPQKKQVLDFFKEQEISEKEAIAFWNYNEIRGWKIGRTKVENWVLLAEEWIKQIDSKARSTNRGDVTGDSRSEYEIRVIEQIEKIWTETELKLYRNTVFKGKEYEKLDKPARTRIVAEFQFRWTHYILPELWNQQPKNMGNGDYAEIIEKKTKEWKGTEK